MKTAFLSDLTQKEGGSEAIGVVSTPTLYPSPKGEGVASYFIHIRSPYPQRGR
jgi:hypothetical protein